MKRFLALMLVLACLLGCALAESAERIPAPYTYNLADDEFLQVENLIFNGDVIVSGGNGIVMFANCEFNGDLVQTSETGSKAFVLPDCTVNGRYVLRNSIQETTFDAPFPKILSYIPAEVVTEDCFGAFISLGGFDTVFTGETYTLAGSDVFFDANKPEQGMVPYEGQEANLFLVARWWENGEENILTYAEFDPGL